MIRALLEKPARLRFWRLDQGAPFVSADGWIVCSAAAFVNLF